MIRLALVVALTAPMHLAAAGTFKVECPAEIRNSSVRLVETPVGWQGTVMSPIYLHNAAPLNGPPAELGVMIGESIKNTKNLWVTRYPLDGAYPNGKWFTCDYGMLNELSLSRRLPDDTRECTVSRRPGKYAGQNVFDIVCRN